MYRKLLVRSSQSRGLQSGSNKPRHRRLLSEALECRLALTALPAGFAETLVNTASTLSGPTAMEFSPTGQLWVLEQGGRAKLLRNDGSTHTALTLTVDSAGERGLLGIAFDPAYDGAGANTDYVYLYYTVPRLNPTTPAHNRLSRFTVSDAGTATPTLSGEVVLRNLPPEDEDNNPGTNGDTNHNGGAIHFGPDGKLYVAVGDHNYDTTPQSQHVSQTLTTPFGKMLRLNPDGTNPSDNPFYTGSSTDWAGAAWALGLRNPYTFAFDSTTGKMFINDVGEGVWEEINLGERGVNYGWAGSSSPLWEGFESPPPAWPNYRDPVMAYDHSNSLPTPAGVAITGGVFYPANSQFGSAFAGKYFFADYGGNFIRVFDPANPGSVSTPDTSTGFASSLTAGQPVDLKVDAAGNLYYLSRGGNGRVYRISYNGGYNATVDARHVFYNQSAFDGNNAAINAADDAAIATDKSAYLPGSGQATFANTTSYSRGINGIMIDIAGNHGPLSAADFTFKVGTNNTPSSWPAAPAPSAVVVRPGAGAGGADRVEITWADNAIQNTWLYVTVEGNDAAGGFNTNTGLAASDHFFFGNLVGNAGVGDGTLFFTSPTDELAARGNPGAATVTNVFDYNRDGFVNPTDQLIARNASGSLPRLNLGNPPAAPQSSEDDGSRATVASALALLNSESEDEPSVATSDWQPPGIVAELDTRSIALPDLDSLASASEVDAALTASDESSALDARLIDLLFAALSK